jgi:TetR/AcrR family transcriptional regulator, mexJK operon transcriptional repressor
MSNPGPAEAGDASIEGESRVDRIITEAARLFRDKGFSGASMSDLARQVGVSKPALYHHFASKEELFVAVATRGPKEAADAMTAIASDVVLPAAEKLRRLLDLAYDNIVHSTAGQMMPTIAETSAEFPDLARRFRDGFIAGQQSALRKVVDDGIASGEFTAADTDFLVEMTFGPPIMISITRSMYGRLPDTPPIDLEAAKRRHYDALLRLLS